MYNQGNELEKDAIVFNADNVLLALERVDDEDIRRNFIFQSAAYLGVDLARAGQASMAVSGNRHLLPDERRVYMTVNAGV